MPKSPGLYRIRVVGELRLAYVGQTGALRQRLGQLAGVYGEVMPYNDPHTAGPCLWALRQDAEVDFEVSVVEVAGDVVRRKALEAVVASLHRVEHGCSPTANFGRMPDGWRKSSSNNARLVAEGRRQRGGRDGSARRVADAPPPVGLDGNPLGDAWMGHAWSPWSAELPAGGRGLYRARSDEAIAYVGQGVLAARIAAHRRKGEDSTHRQTGWFSTPDLVWSFVELIGAETSQLLELENDLIAAHVVAAGVPPLAQFLG